MAIRRMQNRRGTAAEWSSANPVLAAGEMGFETDSNRVKIGTGTQAWNDLKYLGGGREPSFYTLYGPEPRANHALQQSSTGGYVWPGDATSASIGLFLFDRPPFRRAQFARWLTVWTPQAAQNGIRLVHADSGPANITQMVELTGGTEVTPIATGTIITDAFNALIDGGAQKMIGHQINAGASGPVIFLSRLEVLWEN